MRTVNEFERINWESVSPLFVKKTSSWSVVSRDFDKFVGKLPANHFWDFFLKKPLGIKNTPRTTGKPLQGTELLKRKKETIMHIGKSIRKNPKIKRAYYIDHVEVM